MYQMKKGGSSKNSKQQAAIAMSMKAAGKKPKKMEMGGSMKDVPADKEKSLGKLPTAVRNKMGYKKTGGSLKKMKMGGSCGTSKSMKKYAEGGNINTSIVDRLKSEKMGSDMNSRKKLAESLGIKDYTGSSEQNVKLLKAFKSKYDPSEQAAKNPNVTVPAKPSIASRLRGDEYKKPATNTKEPAKDTKEPAKKYTSTVFKSRMKKGGMVGKSKKK